MSNGTGKTGTPYMRGCLEVGYIYVPWPGVDMFSSAGREVLRAVELLLRAGSKQPARGVLFHSGARQGIRCGIGMQADLPSQWCECAVALGVRPSSSWYYCVVPVQDGEYSRRASIRRVLCAATVASLANVLLTPARDSNSDGWHWGARASARPLSNPVRACARCRSLLGRHRLLRHTPLRARALSVHAVLCVVVWPPGRERRARPLHRASVCVCV